MRAKKTKSKRIGDAALKLIRDSLFLFRVIQKTSELGIVGEKRNCLVLFLAGLTKNFEKPVSVMEKGPSSSGKSELLKAVLSLFPHECVIKRASLSRQAPVHGVGDLTGKILYIVEYRGARDALYLTRLLQSEAEIVHEFATAVGAERGTIIASRKGSPVVLTTTTLQSVFSDDETRFLSIQADDSEGQTQEVIAAHFCPDLIRPREAELPVWHEAIRLLTKKVPNIRHPHWFSFLATQIPAEEPRARRDAVRFINLLKAVALCRSYSDGRINKKSSKEIEIEIDFADYCVAHRILSRAFTSTFAGVHPQALKLASAVRALHKQLDRAVSVKELSKHLGWEQALVYKYVKQAEKQKLVQYEPGTHVWNLKRLLPGLISRPSFLPDPKFIFQSCEEIGDDVQFIDPLTGRKRIMSRGGGTNDA